MTRIILRASNIVTVQAKFSIYAHQLVRSNWPPFQSDISESNKKIQSLIEGEAQLSGGLG